MSVQSSVSEGGAEEIEVRSEGALQAVRNATLHYARWSTLLTAKRWKRRLRQEHFTLKAELAEVEAAGAALSAFLERHPEETWPAASPAHAVLAEYRRARADLTGAVADALKAYGVEPRPAGLHEQVAQLLERAGEPHEEDAAYVVGWRRLDRLKRSSAAAAASVGVAWGALLLALAAAPRAQHGLVLLLFLALFVPSLAGVALFWRSVTRWRCPHCGERFFPRVTPPRPSMQDGAPPSDFVSTNATACQACGHRRPDFA